MLEMQIWKLRNLRVRVGIEIYTSCSITIPKEKYLLLLIFSVS